MPAPYRTVITDRGRVCTRCFIFIPWINPKTQKPNFRKEVKATTGYRANCIRCGLGKAPLKGHKIEPTKYKPYRVVHDPTGTGVWLNGWHNAYSIRKTLDYGHWPEGIIFRNVNTGIEEIVIGKECEPQDLKEVRHVIAME